MPAQKVDVVGKDYECDNCDEYATVMFDCAPFANFYCSVCEELFWEDWCKDND